MKYTPLITLILQISLLLFENRVACEITGITYKKLLKQNQTEPVGLELFPTQSELSQEIKSTLNAKTISKRDTYGIGKGHQCTEVHTNHDQFKQTIKDIGAHSYEFFIKPENSFHKIIFNMKIDNNWDIAGPYVSDNSVSFGLNDLQSNTQKNGWYKFKVEYYQHSSPGRDKLALSVTNGNTTRKLVSRRWRRTHTYMGFRISVEGDAQFLFDCEFDNIIEVIPKAGIGQPVLLGGLLLGCFLLMVAGWVLYMIVRRSRRHNNSPEDEQHPPIPALPASLLLGWNKNQKGPDIDHVYDEFNDDTLDRLRQKMNMCNLSGMDDDPKKTPTENHYEVPRSSKPNPNDHYDTPKERQKSQTGLEKITAWHPNDPIYLNDMNVSLMEEKMKVRPGYRDSVPESHYVEMHGILNRKSSIEIGKEMNDEGK